MKKNFYSIWMRVVLCCFWVMICTFLIIGFTIHLMNRLNIWNSFPLPITGLHFIILLALVALVLGMFISVFIFRYALNPVSELSKAMQKVADGDYTVKLDVPGNKSEIYELLNNFNVMVQELNSTETLHSDFISNVSHEFKTPLATISGYATLLQDDTLTPQERNEYIETIITSARELSKMTGNILSLSCLENQTIITDQEDFRVDEQIRWIILRAESAWSAKNLVLEPELDKITWYGNQELTSHIWSNLIDNAIKFTPAGGEITIKASMDEEWLTVSVQDSGIGIPPDIQSRVSTNFIRVIRPTRKRATVWDLHLSIRSSPFTVVI